MRIVEVAVAGVGRGAASCSSLLLVLVARLPPSRVRSRSRLSVVCRRVLREQSVLLLQVELIHRRLVRLRAGVGEGSVGLGCRGRRVRAAVVWLRRHAAPMLLWDQSLAVSLRSVVQLGDAVGGRQRHRDERRLESAVVRATRERERE